MFKNQMGNNDKRSCNWHNLATDVIKKEDKKNFVKKILC